MSEMKEGICPKHGNYYTALFIGCPTCWAEDANEESEKADD